MWINKNGRSKYKKKKWINEQVHKWKKNERTLQGLNEWLRIIIILREQNKKRKREEKVRGNCMNEWENIYISF